MLFLFALFNFAFFYFYFILILFIFFFFLFFLKLKNQFAKHLVEFLILREKKLFIFLSFVVILIICNTKSFSQRWCSVSLLQRNKIYSLVRISCCCIFSFLFSNNPAKAINFHKRFDLSSLLRFTRKVQFFPP